MAELFINLSKLRHNIRTVQNICKPRGLEVIGVVKGCHKFSPIIQAFQRGGIGTLGMSRVDVGIEASAFLHERPILISLPSIRECRSVVRYFKASLNSEIDAVRALAEEARKQSRVHGIILMVESGDLREGVMPDQVNNLVERILSLKGGHVSFEGLGANTGCLSGTLPNEENTRLIADLSADIEKRFGAPVKTLSIGGSIMLDWIEKHGLPEGVNQIRVGEAIFLGNVPNAPEKHPDLFEDVFVLRGEVVEVKEKPSVPWGPVGRDAMGHCRAFEDRGVRKRAILNFGLVDTDPSGLAPKDPGLDIISSNSDYTVVDVTDCEGTVPVGHTFDFTLNYSAMIQTFLSPFIDIRLSGDFDAGS